MPKKISWRKRRRSHAKVRAAERYDLNLTRQDLANIVGMIRNRKIVSSRRQSRSKNLIAIDYKDRRLVLVYSQRHQEVITFLPEDCNQALKLESSG